MSYESAQMLRALGSVEAGMAAMHELQGATQTASLVGLHGRLSESVLGAAALCLQEKYPALQAVIGTLDACFHLLRPQTVPAIGIRRVSLTHSGQWRAELETELNQPLDAAHSLWKLALLDQPDQGDCCVVLTCHHAIVDAVSLLVLLGDLLTFCDDLISKQALQIHAIPLAPALDIFLKRQAALSPATTAQTAGPAYERIAALGDRRTAVLHDSFSGAELTHLLQAARRSGITLNSLIAGALLCAAEMTGLGARLRINTAVSLRDRTAPRPGADWIACYIRVLAFELDLAGRGMTQVSADYHQRMQQQLAQADHAAPSLTLSQLRENGQRLRDADRFMHGVALTNHGRVHFPALRAFTVLRYINVANRVAGNFAVALHVTTLDETLTLAFTWALPLISTDRIAALQRQLRTNLITFHPALEKSHNEN